MELEEAPKQSYSDKEKGEIFNNEFLPHINSMYNFGYRLTLDRDDAKDLVQDTYLKAYRFIESFQKELMQRHGCFASWKTVSLTIIAKRAKSQTK